MKQTLKRPITAVFLLLGGILLLALILRLFLLGTLPISLNNDEIDFIVQAKSVFYSYTDLEATWNPLSLQPLAKEAKSEILYLLLAPIFGPLPLSLFTTRLPYVFVNLGIILLLYAFTRRFLSQGAALAVAFVATINPWMLFLSRTTFESHPALLFYLAGIVTMLYARGRKVFLALPFFLLGFYSYMGTKVIFLPLIIATSVFAWHLHKKRYRTEYLIFTILAGLFFIGFLLTLSGGSSSRRVGEFSFNSEKITTAVNQERRASIPHPMETLLTNKVTITGREALERYLGAFSFDMLFSQGDPHSLYGFWDHGLFYYADIILIIAGIIFLYRKKRDLFYYLLVLLLIGALPSALSQVDTSYVHRSNMTLTVLIIFAGVGLYAVIAALYHIKYGKVFLTAGILLLALQVINFYHIYLFRNPIYNPLQGAYENRIIARFAALSMQNNQNVVILADNGPALLKSYLFYTDSINRSTINEVHHGFRTTTPHFQKLSIEKDCPQSLDPRKTYILFSVKCSDLYPDIPYHIIPILKDGAPIYKIYNDRLCSEIKLSPYPLAFPLSMFNVEKLDKQTFCQSFITDRTSQ